MASDNLPVPARPQESPLATFGDFALNLWHSFPREDGDTVLALVQGKADALGEQIGKVVRIRHVLSHRVESVDEETGEVTVRDRIVVVAPDGKAYATMSDGIRRSLQMLMAVRGLPPWAPPLAVCVEQQNTRRGRRTYLLTPVKDGE